MTLKKILAAFLGIWLVGIGVAFNAAAKLGNDPVGIFYDGIRNALGLGPMQLGTASNLVNLALVILLFSMGMAGRVRHPLLFTEKRYLSIGTLIYILPYGSCVNLGSLLYPVLFRSQSLLARGFGSLTGCFLLYIGVALFITADIGLDPMTGLAMVLKDWLRWDFKRAKWLIDATLTLSGFLLGGRLGLVTILTAVLAAPTIQAISKLLGKIM